MKGEADNPFTRHAGNPIITAQDLPYAANSVFNAGAAKPADCTLLLLRVEDRRGLSHLTAARSSNGIDGWVIDEKPCLQPDDAHPEEIWGIEDPRITRLEEKKCWAVAYASFSRGGPLVSLALTEDFHTFEKLGAVLPPDNKDAALFPTRIGGKWAMLHRPCAAFEGVGAHIWISLSPDLKHWGQHRIVLSPREGGWWDAGKIGLSPPPLRTERGWLIMYHGVRDTAAGCLYRCGLALLDLDDPTKVIRRCDEWVFGPEQPYERVGDVGGVVFPCGWVLEQNELRLYYGAADTGVALATANIDDVLAWLDRH